MSGLYNMMFGHNRAAGFLLDALHIDYKELPRFRDCFLHVNGTIVIYTRTGGGNRPTYEAQNEWIRQHPGFLRDEDDSFDSTYALFYFAVPEEAKDTCAKIVEAGMTVNPPERWKEALERLRKI